MTSPARSRALELPHPYDARDALGWALLPALILAVIPIGLVSGDGLAQSASYASGTWFWNPNHLLYEPLGAWWQSTLTRIGIVRSHPDQLKLLSIVSGSIALGIFRYFIAGPLAAHRLGANLATVWVAFGATYIGLWLSDETQMVQMPLLMGTAAASVRYFAQPCGRTALLIGASAGLAALLYISDGLIAVTLAGMLALWHLRQRQGEDALHVILLIGLGSAGVALCGFLIAWGATAPPGVGLIHWLTSYGGGHGSARIASNYGMHFTLSGMGIATARALYGSANTIVDVSSIVDALRQRSFGIADIGTSVAFLIATAGIGWMSWQAIRRRSHPRYQAALWLSLAWVLAIVGFGIYWNNSDDQFYFQLAIALGAMMATTPFSSPRSWPVIAGLAALVAWNGSDALRHHILYPRSAYARDLQTATTGASLIVYPGEDEVFRTLFFIPDSIPDHRIAITSLAARYAPSEGLHHLQNSIQDALARGGHVDVIAIFDVSDEQNPWKYLASLDYGRRAVLDILRQFPVQCVSRHVGPFTIRSITPMASSCIPSTASRITN